MQSGLQGEGRCNDVFSADQTEVVDRITETVLRPLNEPVHDRIFIQSPLKRVVATI